MIELHDTNSAAISHELLRGRAAAGPATGMVMTLIVVVDEEGVEEALEAARQASAEHPARVLAVVSGDGRGTGRVDARVGLDQGWSGETALIRLRGEVTKHAASVVLPLLLPDSPVTIWWPHDAPDDPASDPLGALATRRITDAAAGSRGGARRLHRQCASYASGHTDLAWTRLTGWRALLAAALDQYPARVRAASVSAERGNCSADLLVAWLADRLRVEVTLHASAGPGLTDVRLETADGDLRIHRVDGRLATFSTPGSPDRRMALTRRELPELLAEELRHLDEDDVYAAAARRLVNDS